MREGEEWRTGWLDHSLNYKFALLPAVLFRSDHGGISMKKNVFFRKIISLCRTSDFNPQKYYHDISMGTNGGSIILTVIIDFSTWQSIFGNNIWCSSTSTTSSLWRAVVWTMFCLPAIYASHPPGGTAPWTSAGRCMITWSST